MTTSFITLDQLNLKSTASITAITKSAMFINVTNTTILITSSKVIDTDTGNYSDSYVGVFNIADNCSLNLTDVDFNASQTNSLTTASTTPGTVSVVGYNATSSNISIKNVPIFFTANQTAENASSFVFIANKSNITASNISITASINGTITTFAGL